jgi:hypothetical protein
MRSSPKLHLKVSQVTAPLVETTRDGSRQLLVTLLPSPCPARVDLRGTDILLTRSVWTFSYNSEESDRTIEFRLSERISSRDFLELAIVRIPLDWIAPNTVVRESFPMTPVATGFGAATIFLKLHKDESNGNPFSAPLAPISPRANSIFDTFAFTKMALSATSLVFERANLNQLAISEPLPAPPLPAVQFDPESDLLELEEPTLEKAQLGNDGINDELEDLDTQHEPLTVVDVGLTVAGEQPTIASGRLTVADDQPTAVTENLTVADGPSQAVPESVPDEPVQGQDEFCDDIPHFREPVVPPGELNQEEEEGVDDALFVPPIEESDADLLYPPPPSGNANRIRSLDMEGQHVLESSSFLPAETQVNAWYTAPAFLPISVAPPERIDGC